MATITFKDLANIREKYKDERIVFCSGCFDLTHAGHLLFFEDCKQQGDVLVVMIGADDVVGKNKGPGRPIINERMRLKLIESLKPVDYVFIDQAPAPGAHALSYLDEVIGELKPDVYVINEDAWDMPYREEMVKRHGTILKVLKRTAPPEFGEVSTTNIIKKIKALKD